MIAYLLIRKEPFKCNDYVKKSTKRAQDAHLGFARSLKKNTGINGLFIKCHKFSLKNLGILIKKKISASTQHLQKLHTGDS